MKLYAALLLIIMVPLYSMQSPGREGKSTTDSRGQSRRSSKNFNFIRGAGSPTSSPVNSKIESRTASMSPEKAVDKKGSEIRRGPAAQIEQTVELFAEQGISEEELQKKFEEAKRKMLFSRDEHDQILKEILETKINSASAARHQASIALFESAKERVAIAIGNVQAFELYKNPTEVKLALLAILRARNLASYAIAKKICATNPRKYDEWCRFEEETDQAKFDLDKSINDFFSTKVITEEMKTKEIPMHSLLP